MQAALYLFATKLEACNLKQISCQYFNIADLFAILVHKTFKPILYVIIYQKSLSIKWRLY